MAEKKREINKGHWVLDELERHQADKKKLI